MMQAVIVEKVKTEDDELPCVIGERAGEADEARGDQWGVHSIDKVQHT